MTEIMPEIKPTPGERRRKVAGWLPESAQKLAEEWGVERPDQYTMPTWLRPRVKAAIKVGALPQPSFRVYSNWDALQHAVRKLGSSWLDHFGRLKLADGTELLISEPYQLNVDGREQLQAFCQVLGLKYRVEPQSWWFPGRTLRIVIWEATPNE